MTGDPTDVFGQVLSHSDPAGIRLVLGYMNTSDPTMYKDFPGGVLPVCGEVYIPVSGYNPRVAFGLKLIFMLCFIPRLIRYVIAQLFPRWRLTLRWPLSVSI